MWEIGGNVEGNVRGRREEGMWVGEGKRRCGREKGMWEEEGNVAGRRECGRKKDQGRGICEGYGLRV